MVGGRRGGLGEKGEKGAPKGGGRFDEDIYLSISLSDLL